MPRFPGAGTIGIMRYLAIDRGTKRTGLALGDDRTRIASPLVVIQTSNPQELLRQIALAIEEQGPGALVLGLPLNMDDSEGRPAADARRYAAELSQQFSLPVHLVDERLSSAAAEDLLNGSGLTHKQKRARRDALAAAAILQRFLNEQAQGQGQSSPPPDAAPDDAGAESP